LNILVIGLGSIGKRHVRNMQSLGHNNITIVSRSGATTEEFSNCLCYATISEALQQYTYTAAVIATPTSLHITALTELLNAGIPNIYIEKPVSHSYEGIDAILQQAGNTRIMVGFDMHYDPGLQKVKELITSTTIGTPVSVNAQVGQYLPDWRPHEDYRKGMSAQRATGGGVMLDLVHEFDYLYWLMGEADTIACKYANSGSLTIETEEIAEVLIKFGNGAIGTIHLDYLQRKLVRNCMITGTTGSIFWNLVNSEVKWITREKEEQVFSYAGFERNDRFMQIMNDFLQGNHNDNITSLQQGLVSLKMVLAAKHSSDHDVFVKMNQYNPCLS